jgi:hypothetical protein
LPAQAWHHDWIACKLVPMEAQMGDTAVTPTLPDTGSEPEFRPTLRERMGIAAFVFVAVLATAIWIALLAWGVVNLVGAV